ncbi:hypothetical protein SAMN05421504_11147 [Amycolatopsis xylanica]|uniref:Ig-like domain-containing protein n=1 Tax=Amycolatopsis xylanica TaxID=589385 RepID=A0A1H3RFS2_9PSEU|nr:hypothetical protein [Amycolatopsis xylanica]SDZ24175.1 hypothetical protein SAMN05421504_11147 [Amycolatopsis xylanica]
MRRARILVLAAAAAASLMMSPAAQASQDGQTACMAERPGYRFIYPCSTSVMDADWTGDGRPDESFFIEVGKVMHVWPGHQPVQLTNGVADKMVGAYRKPSSRQVKAISGGRYRCVSYRVPEGWSYWYSC